MGNSAKTLFTPCRQEDYVAVGKLGLDQKLYPCRGLEDNSGLVSYLGDLCKRSRPQWVELMILVSALLWPALEHNARGLVVRKVSTRDACGVYFCCVQPCKSCSVLHCNV